MRRLYDHPSDMEPLLPEDPDGGLEGLGWQVVRRAERLGGALHPLTAVGLARVVRVMNSYYSHLIEGYGTTPADLEAVLRGHGEGTPQRRDLQQLHFAHLATQEAMAARLAARCPVGVVAWPVWITTATCQEIDSRGGAHARNPRTGGWGWRGSADGTVSVKGLALKSFSAAGIQCGEFCPPAWIEFVPAGQPATFERVAENVVTPSDAVRVRLVRR